MQTLSQIVNFLDRTLRTADYEDESQNGLQVESEQKNIKKVAVAVDSGLSIVKKAVAAEAQLLIVHHGLFWNHPSNLTAALAKKISLLMKSGCSLYVSHLPLDGNLKFGNAALLAKLLGFKNIKPFCRYGGNFVGVKAQTGGRVKLAQIAAKCKKIPSAVPFVVLPFGRKDIKNIGIVTGSGSFAIANCASEGLDLLISGEAKQSAYHLAKELAVNALFAGHYATETFGVRALGGELSRRFKVKSVFIDEPTGI